MGEQQEGHVTTIGNGTANDYYYNHNLHISHRSYECVSQVIGIY